MISPLPNAMESGAAAGLVQKVSEVGVIGKPHAALRRVAAVPAPAPAPVITFEFGYEI